MKFPVRLRMTALAAIAAAQVTQVHAQDQAQTDTADAGIQDIVVTARRSSESMQSVPVAITALSGQFLERQNVTDATALPLLTPSLTIAQQPASLSAASVFIRGIGNQEPSAVSEQGVGIYLDGVYLARAAGAVFDLLDLERVEVLRGPQGTLFGRNTIGGAIQLVSKKPTEDMHATVKAGIGKYSEWFVRGRVDTGRIGNTPFKLSVAGQHRGGNGFINNAYAPSSQDPGSLKADSVAVALQADLGALTVDYNFDWDNRSGTPAFFQVVAASQTANDYYSASPNYGGDPFQIGTTPLQNVVQAGFTDGSGNYRYSSKTRVSGHALTLAWEASPNLTVKSITGYRRFFQDTILPLSGQGNLLGPVVDFTSPTLVSVQPVTPYNGNNAPQRQHQWSEELQLLGKAGDFSYLLGGYYFHEKSSEANQQSLTFVLPVAALPFAGFPQEVADGIAALNPGLNTVGLNLAPLQAFSGTAESVAAFGQVSWKPAALDEKLEVTAGGRYTSDKKTILLAGDVVPTQSGSTKFDNVSWLGSLSYKISPSVLVYARASSGYRSGGLNPRTAVINTFQPEKAKSYEAGIKSDFLDNHLRVNLAGYVTDYSNLQVQQFAAGTGGATSLIVNAGKVRLSGFEAEVVAAPVRGLTFDGSVGYVHTKYKTFLFRDPFTNVVSDVAGIARPVYTPQWTAHVGGEYVASVGDAIVRLRADYSYASKMYFNALSATAPFNDQILAPANNNLKARVSFEDLQMGASKLDLGFWGDNLTNTRPIIYGIDFGTLGFAGANFKKPTTWGVDAKISF